MCSDCAKCVLIVAWNVPRTSILVYSHRWKFFGRRKCTHALLMLVCKLSVHYISTDCESKFPCFAGSQVVVPKSCVGIIIGKGGRMIKMLESEFCVRIQFG